MVNQMSVINTRGDTKIEWDPDKEEEVKIARKAFDEAIKNGYQAFRVYDNGKKGEAITKFDKTAEKLILTPAIMGG